MKKLLALCLTVMLVVAMVPVIGAVAADDATFVVSEATATFGQEVTVTVSTKNNPGIAYAKVQIGYDAEALELVKAVSGGFNDTATKFGPTTKNPFTVNWNDGLVNVDTDGNLAVITFKVKETAKVGTYELAVTYNPDDVGTTDLVNVAFATQNGAIKVVCEHKNTSEIPAVDATCTATGLTAGTKCDDCGETIKAQEEVAVKPHTEVTEGDKDATCTEAGSTGTTKCDVCGEVIKEAEVIDALGHKEVVEGAKDATCEAPGYTGDTKCSVCGETLATGEEIPQLPHNWVAKDKKDATCAEEGYEAHYACDAGCGKLAKDEAGEEAVTAEEIAIAKLPHTIGKVDGVAATEEKTGIKEHYACSECEALFADAEGKTEITAEETIIPVIEKAPENADDGDKAPATNDLVNMFVVVAMLLAAAATVVVLKKKA